MPVQILVIEDSKADLFLIREAVAAAKIEAAIHIVQDGHQAVEFIDHANEAVLPCPDLVLLDLNLPRKDGIEVLRHLRRTQACRKTPVLIVTSSDSESDRDAVKTLGYDGYFRKPSDYAEFMKLGPIIKELLHAT